MNEAYQQLVGRKRQEYGDGFDSSDLDPRFAAYYGQPIRVKVDTCGMVLTGRVGVTTGWKPVFLLIRTCLSIGSPWTLGKSDKILAVKANGERSYMPIA